MRTVFADMLLVALSINPVTSAEPHADAAALLDLQPQESPRALATEYLAATSRADWSLVARLSHVDDLQRMKELWMKGWEKDPDTVRELFGLAANESLETFDAVELFARMLERFEEEDDEDDNALDSLVGSQGSTVLGTVKDGQDVHVVFRTNVRFMNVPVARTAILTTRAFGKGWLAKVPVDMEAVLFAVLKNIDE